MIRAATGEADTLGAELVQRLAAILAADAAGYSRLMAGDERATVAALDAARAVFKARITSNQGRVVDMAGDSVLAVFQTAIGAVLTALAIQEDLQGLAADVPVERRLRFRMGIHLGDVIEKADGTVYGDGVNIASRLQGLAEPGGVTISESIRTAVRGKVDSSFEDKGEQTVKNIPEPVRAYSISRDGSSAGKGPGRADGAYAAIQVPPEADSLIGREVDLEAVRGLLDTHRMVTVVGAGGIGKTTLAAVAARRQAGRQADGVRWVDLSMLQSAESLVPTLAVATGILLPVASTAALAHALAGSRMLVVLDNCEHIAADVAGLLGPLLSAAPSVSWLATSQEPLGVPGEHVYRLQGLAVPPAGVSLDEARSFGAFLLLEERARQIDQRFSMDEASREAAIDICRQLDGMALAIEMAAARLPAIGVTALRSMLDERLQWLRNRHRGAPTRQQTLRSTLEWSHSLLAPAEQRMLRRLAVFAGSFTLDLVQEVVHDHDAGEFSVLDALCGLVERSLVQVESTQPARYRLLESMRLFGLQRLDDAGESRAVLKRHASALATLGLRMERANSERSQAELVQTYDPHYADFDKAFHHACALEDGDLAAALLTGLRVLVQLRGDILTMETRLLAALPLLDGASPLARARILTVIASCGWVRLKPSQSAVAAQAVDAWRALGDNPTALHHALLLHALGLAREDDASAAQRVLAEARLLESRHGPMNPLAGAFHAAWIAMFGGDAPTFRERLTLARSLAQAQGADRWVAQIESWLPAAALMGGNLEETIALGEAAAARLRELRQGDFLSNTLFPLLTALLLTGKVERARQVAGELWSGAGWFSTKDRSYLINQLAMLAKLLQRFAPAARLRGYADAFDRLHGTGQRRDPDAMNMAQIVDAAIDAAVGADAHRRWREEGAELGASAIESIVKDLLATPLAYH